MTKATLTDSELREAAYRVKCDHAAFEIWKLLDGPMHKSRRETGIDWSIDTIKAIREIVNGLKA